MSTIGPAGERGKTGDHGQRGDRGDTGKQGIQGKPGLRSRSLTWIQALVMFLLIVAIGLVMAFTFERQQQRLQAQQNAIEENARRIAEERYLGCLGGVQIIQKLNAQTKGLIEVERRHPTAVSKERIKAHEQGLITLPDPACRR